MKHFVQFNAEGKVIDSFALREGPGDDEQRRPNESLLADPFDDYCNLAIGDSVRFSGTTTLKRIY